MRKQFQFDTIFSMLHVLIALLTNPMLSMC